MPRLFPPMAAIAATTLLNGVAQAADQPKLAQIDRTFVCPEALPNDQSRAAALDRFMDKVAEADPQVTLAQIIQFRMTLLRKHHCKRTLDNLARPEPSNDPPPPAAPSHS